MGGLRRSAKGCPEVLVSKLRNAFVLVLLARGALLLLPACSDDFGTFAVAGDEGGAR